MSATARLGVDLFEPSFLPNSVNVKAVKDLGELLSAATRQARYSPETFFLAVAMASNGLAGSEFARALDPETKAFLAERFEATAMAMRGGLQ